MKKQYIIPVFIPHLGYENDCIFYNQNSINGKREKMTKKEVKEIIETNLKNLKEEDAQIEIAFLGGSFTAIDNKEQEELLQIGYEYIEKGIVDSIRISTKPNYINKEVLKKFKKYKVKTIELDVQSANDYILKKSNKTYNFKDVKKASKLIRWNGFKLGHQMMIGLPESTRIDEINTAKKLIKLRPKMIRIYPVLVVKNTKLEQDLKEGRYEALSVIQAVEICKQLVRMFDNKKIDIIGIDLQNTEEISNSIEEKNEIVAGPYHPAFRQLVETSMWYDAVLEKIKKLNVKVKQVEVIVNPNDANQVIGYKNENVLKLKETYDVDMTIKQDENIKQGKIKLKVTQTYNDFLEE